MFYMPVSVVVTPNLIQVSVSAMVKPPVFPDQDITVMMFERMQRFVMYVFIRCRRRNIRFRGSLYVGYTHNTS
jgi:hypothetical protein